MAHRDVVRAQTILLLAEGMTVSAVGRQVGLARRIICKWADRFVRNGLCRRRKRQVEFIGLLDAIDGATPVSVTQIHVVCDNVRTHTGTLVRAWLDVRHSDPWNVTAIGSRVSRAQPAASRAFGKQHP